MIENKNIKIYLTNFVCIALLVLPVDNRSIMPSLPISGVFELISFFILSFIFYYLIKTKNKYLVFSMFIIFLLKLSVLITPINLWSVCFQDDVVPRTTRHKFTDRSFECEKSYQINFTNYSYLEKIINYENIDDKREYLGANNSSFKLNFLNNKKFNHRGQDNLLRSWLPFEMTLKSPNKSGYKYIKVDFIGELEIYQNGELIFYGKGYKQDFIRALKVDGSQLYLKYSFIKDPPVYIMDSLPENYPADRYAHLSIYGSDNLSDWELMKEKTMLSSAL